MNGLLTVAIGTGLVISLIFSELFGIAPGGMIVPGYLALYLNKPLDIILTMLAGFLTFAIVHALSSVMIVYGRRRTVLMILVGYLMGIGFRMMISNSSIFAGDNLTVVGYIIPGLIAIWLDRQGVIVTSATLMIVSVIVRLTLILTIGTDLKI